MSPGYRFSRRLFWLLLLISSSILVLEASAHLARQQEQSKAAAERAYQDARDLYDQGTPEARRASIDKFKEASELFRTAGDQTSAAVMLLFIGRTYVDLNETQKTIDVSSQAQSLFHALGNARMEANAFSMMGRAYLDLENKQKALESYNQELALWESIDDKKKQALALSNIGLVYYSMGDKENALTYYDKAIRFVNDVDDSATKARLYGSLGELYAELGRYELASGFLQIAIGIYKRLGYDEEANRLTSVLNKSRASQAPQPTTTAQNNSSDDKPSLVVQLGHSSFVTAVSFSADGRFILTGSQDTTARLWEAATGKEIRRFIGHSAAISEVAFTSDNDVVTSSLDGTARLWEGKTGLEVRRLTAPQSAFRLSPDGRFALSCCDGRTGSLWEVATGKEVKRFENPFIGPAVAFSPDGKFVVTGIGVRSDPTEPYKPAVVMWETATGVPVWGFEGHSADINSVAFSADGTFVLTGSGSREGKDNTARLLDSKTGHEVKRFEHEWPVLSVALSPDGRTAVTASADQTARLWDAATGKELRRFAETRGAVNVIVFSSDGKLVAVGNGDSVNLYDVATGQLMRVLTGYAYQTTTSVVSPDGRFIATGNSFSLRPEDGVGVETGGAVCLWDTLTGQEVERLPAKDFGVTALAYSDDGHLMLAGLGVYASLWDLATDREIKRFTDESKGRDENSLFSEINAVAISHDNNFILTGFGSIKAGNSNYVIVWSVQTGKEVSRFPLTGELKTVAFSLDGRFIMTGSGGHVFDDNGELVEQEKTVIVRNVAEGKETKRLSGNRAIFSPDGKLILTSGDDDNSARIWDASSFKELRVLPRQHQRDVEALSFSNDLRYVLTGDFSGIVRLWESETGKLIKEFETHAGPVQSISLMGGNRYLLTLGDDSVMRLWNVETGQEACQLISFRDGTWVAVDAEGRFDTNNLEEIRGLHWSISDDPMKPLPLEIFMREYYEPRLVQRVMAGDKFKDVKSLADLNRLQPAVRITNIEPQQGQPDQVTVTVEVAQSSDQVLKDAKSVERRTDVYDLRLFRDGQLVGQAPSLDSVMSTQPGEQNNTDELGAWRQNTKVKLDAGGKASIKFENIRLSHLQDIKQVDFSAYAFNVDKVKSLTDRRSFVLPQNLTRTKGRAYIITVGVNAYENSDFDLEFAGDDARRMAEVVTQKLNATGQYEKVIPVTLISDYETKEGRRIATEKQATKDNFHAVLDRLAGKNVDRKLLEGVKNADQLQKATPDDLVLIMYSSHGYADRAGNFYFIPYDTGPGTGKLFTDTVRQHSISSDELSLWLRDVDAGEMIMIVDACHSAAAIEGSDFKPGPMGSRGLGQLSYDKGMKILTATQSDNVALENKQIKQGLLTYALVRDGIEARQADFKPKDNVINISEWLSYGVDRVPKLYEEVQAGKIQSFGLDEGQQSKVVVVAQNGKSNARALEEVTVEAKAQQPSLFDFTRRRREVALVK